MRFGVWHNRIKQTLFVFLSEYCLNRRNYWIIWYLAFYRLVLWSPGNDVSCHPMREFRRKLQTVHQVCCDLDSTAKNSVVYVIGSFITRPIITQFYIKHCNGWSCPSIYWIQRLAEGCQLWLSQTRLSDARIALRSRPKKDCINEVLLTKEGHQINGIAQDGSNSSA